MPEPEAIRRALDPFSLEALELPAVIEMLSGFLSGPISAPLLARVGPQTDLQKIQRDLELAREAREYLREGARPGLGGLIEPTPLLEKLRIEGLILAAPEILALVDVARAALDLYRTFAQKVSQTGDAAGVGAGLRDDLGQARRRDVMGRGPGRDSNGPTHTSRLADLAGGIPDFRALVADLSGKISPDGTLDSSASPELGRVRRHIDRAKVEIQSSLERVMQRFSKDSVLQDAVVTIRNDRFVIPVRAEEKRRVQGVVHAASSSGATVYIEPLETLGLNNELVELQDREFAEVQRLLGEFTRRLRERHNDLNRASEILAEIDWAFARGVFSVQNDCCIPEIGQNRTICLKGVRHPLLIAALRGGNSRIIHLSLELKPPKRTLIISGPNTGGKTVALKTIGIVVLMAQAGIPVPADEIKLPLFTRVLADIGDQQSIAASLSTFSAHVTNIEAMAQAAGPNDLVLLDEIGASTEPHEGAALAIAILEHLRQRGAVTVVTTHHSRLKAYAAETAEAVNAAMEFDEATLRPTYRLVVGLPGKSSALEIAARLGLENSIVEKARSLLDPVDAEAAALVAGLHQQRAEMDCQREAIELQRHEQEKRQAEWERQFQLDRRTRLRELDSRLESTLKQYAKEWEQSLEELRRQSAPAKAVTRGERIAANLVRGARAEWDAQVLEALGDAAPAPHPTPAPPLAVGQRVQVRNVPTPGVVSVLLDDGQVEVEMGRLKMRVGRDEISQVTPGGPTTPMPIAKSSYQSEAPEELNVIGTTAEEAREQVDKFLDQAFLAGRSRVRVIHGHGKGILRKTLHEMFADHPHVEKFYLATPQEGGSGATIVELAN